METQITTINAPAVLNVFQTEPMKDFTHEMKLPMHKFKSAWRVRIWNARNASNIVYKLIVITDLNQGMSVTNAAEYIITDLVMKYYYGFDKNHLFFFEHYEPTAHHSGEFDRIVPQWDGNRCTDVEWQHFARIKK